MTVAFFRTILEPYAMPYVPEQCIEGLMQDEEPAAAARKGISFYYEEIAGYVTSVRHIESLFQRNPGLSMDTVELCGEILDYQMLTVSGEE